MFLTTHAAAGILISQYVTNPYAVFGASFASHFVLDFVPHGDEQLYHDSEWRIQKKYRRVVLINLLDVAALTGLIVWAIHHPGDTTPRLMLIGILGSILPDFLSFLFPILHERLSWLSLMRWLYAITKPTGLRYLVRAQNWIHNLLHHEIIRRDIPLWLGLSTQIALIACILWVVK